MKLYHITGNGWISYLLADKEQTLPIMTLWWEELPTTKYSGH